MNTPNLRVNISDYTQSASTPGSVEVYVSGVTRRGPVNDPSNVIDTYDKFVRIFGKSAPLSLFEDPTNTAKDFHIYVQRLLSYGARLRVNRIVHNTGESITKPVKKCTSIKAVAKDSTADNPKTVDIFSMQPKYPGKDYNGIKVNISPASNGNKNAFDMDIVWPNYPEYNESYTNIPNPNLNKPAADQTYLDQVMKLSQLLEFEYLDVVLPEGFTEPFTVSMGASTTMVGGDDGEPVVDSDFVGDDMGKGISAFDQMSGARIIAFPGVYSETVQTKGVSYATKRKDLIYMGSWKVTPSTYEADITAKDACIGDSNKAIISCGGIKILDTNTDKTVVISEIADVIGLCVSCQNDFGAWFDPASQQRAKVLNAIGVGNNFGTPALSNVLNDLAIHGINALVSRSGVIEWSSSYTSQKTDSALSFGSVAFLMLYMEEVISPILRRYLKEPCDIPTFKGIYREINPFLRNLSSTQSRALWKYEYLGDQDANSLDSLKVNQKEDVQIGKYKIFIKLWAIVPLVDVTVNMMLVMGDGEVGIEIG